MQSWTDVIDGIRGTMLCFSWTHNGICGLILCQSLTKKDDGTLDRCD
jgi:hypothetical protein